MRRATGRPTTVAPPPVQKRRRGQDSSTDEDEKDRPRKLQTGPERLRRPTKAAWILVANGHQPVYTAKPDRRAGSASVTAVLGPASLAVRANDANPNLPSGIAAARRAYPRHAFKAGHMLNCDLGGDGQNSANLTILTSSANTAMTRYDNALKQAVSALDALYERLRTIATTQQMLDTWAASDCAIRVVITAIGQWGDSPPDSYIASRVTIDAQLINESNLGLGRLAGQLSASALRSAQDAVANVKRRVALACGPIPNVKQRAARRVAGRRR